MGLVLIVLICTLYNVNAVVVTSRNKPASSSSSLSGMGPQEAVDGDTYAHYPNVFHTDKHNSHEWWQVDLQEEVISPTITIYFRVPFALRRNGVRVSWSKTSSIPTVFCHTITGAADGSNIAAVYNVTSCTGLGRYLTLSIVTNNGDGVCLDFGEVEVHACSLTSYGTNCDQACPCGYGGTCYPDTQQCITTGGPCPSMTYGAACDNDCHCAGATCDETSGVCPSGCAAGWTGSNCNTVCVSMRYGVSCSQTCHCAGATCDHITGVCPSGCDAGWTGTTCNTACGSMQYGSNCDQDCHCAGDTCDVITGVCPSGCAEGWTGSTCGTLTSANAVVFAMKYISVCSVNVVYEQTTVSMATLLAMETVSRTTRVECMHACDALVLCTAFTFTVPDCSLWMSGNSDLSGTQLVWTVSNP